MRSVQNYFNGLKISKVYKKSLGDGVSILTFSFDRDFTSEQCAWPRRIKVMSFHLHFLLCVAFRQSSNSGLIPSLPYPIGENSSSIWTYNPTSDPLLILRPSRVITFVGYDANVKRISNIFVVLISAKGFFFIFTLCFRGAGIFGSLSPFFLIMGRVHFILVGYRYY